MTKPFFLMALAFVLVAAIGVAAAHAEDYTLTLQDHAFTPDPITLPAGKQVTLRIRNLQSTPAEFESSDLEREKVVSANGTIAVLVGPLGAGTYTYVDDFHRATTGTIIVK